MPGVVAIGTQLERRRREEAGASVAADGAGDGDLRPFETRGRARARRPGIVEARELDERASFVAGGPRGERTAVGRLLSRLLAERGRRGTGRAAEGKDDEPEGHVASSHR